MLLSPTQARTLLQHAFENRYAILAINADSHAAVGDCLEAARQADAPVIIETSLWQIKGHSFGMGNPVLGVARYLADLMVLANSEKYAHIPVIYHTDHIKGPETETILKNAIQGIPVGLQGNSLRLHASTISLDASEMTEDENIENICKLASYAASAGVDITLEMESAVDDRITPSSETEYLIGNVEKRHPGKIALWAPGVGTQHGFTSNDGYSAFQTKVIEDQVSLVQKITGRNIGIALHGSTGLPDEKLRAAALSGVTKVNWSSESLWIRSTEAQKYMQMNIEKYDRTHKEWKNTVMDNGIHAFISKTYVPRVVQKMQVLGSAGQASKFRV